MGPWLMPTVYLLTGNVAGAARLGAGMATRWALGSEYREPQRSLLGEPLGERMGGGLGGGQ